MHMEVDGIVYHKTHTQNSAIKSCY